MGNIQTETYPNFSWFTLSIAKSARTHDGIYLFELNDSISARKQDLN